MSSTSRSTSPLLETEPSNPDGQVGRIESQQIVVPANALRYPQSLSLVQMGQQRREFVTPKPKRRVHILPHRTLEDPRKLDQQAVSRLMTVLIVVFLETINVEIEKKHVVPVSNCSHRFLSNNS